LPWKYSTTSYLLYPKVLLEFQDQRTRYGDVSVLPTRAFFHGMAPGEEIHVHVDRGRTLVIRLVGVSEPDVEGRRAVFLELNGQPRRISVRDKQLGIVVETHRKANPDEVREVGAPLPGLVVSYARREGERLAVVEAMKMETNVTAPIGGRIAKIVLSPGTRVEAGDLLLEIESEPA